MKEKTKQEEEKPKEEQAGNPPIHKFRAGSITASIWKTEVEGRPSYSVTFDKSYKDKEGKWKTTYRYNLADLSVLAELAKQAFQYLIKAQ